jgi:hypothetical protein
MLCEKYKDALIEAAVTGDEMSLAIRSHVDGCSSCATELAQQRSLIAAMDTNLQRQMNAPIPAATLQRIEAHLAQQPQPKRAPRFAQLFAGALATLALAATIVLMWPHTIPRMITGKRVAPQQTQKSAVDQTQLISEPRPQTSESRKFAPQASKYARVRTVRFSPLAGSTHQQPEVLVPPDDRIAFEHFVADFDGKAVLAATLAKRVPMQDLHVAPLDVPDIQTASLTVAPVGESEVVSNR